MPKSLYWRLVGAGVLLTLAVTVYFVATKSGPFLWFARLDAKMGDGESYDAMAAVGFTLLAVASPTAIVLVVARRWFGFPPVSFLLRKHELYVDAEPGVASIRARFWALVLDRAIAGAVITTGAVIAIVAERGSVGWVPGMLLCIAGTVYAYARDGVRGQSVARRLFGMRVVDAETGAPIGFWRSFKRELLLHFGPTAIAELINLARRADRQRWGDRWAKTKVIRTRGSAPPPLPPGSR